MRGFSAKKSTIVTITRPGVTLQDGNVAVRRLDEVVEIALTAPTFGVLDVWRNQAHAEKVAADDENMTLAYIALGLALGDELATPVGKAERVAETAARVKAELAAANFSEGEVGYLLQMVATLSGKHTEVADAAKNSKAPAAAGA